MDKYKKLIYKILFPCTFLIFLFFNITVFLLIYVFSNENRLEAVAYFSYFFSAYTLVVVCIRIPSIVKKIKKKLYINPYTRKFLTEKDLRIRLSLYGGLFLNIAFAVFKCVMGVLYSSKWLLIMAGYNVILSVMIVILAHKDRVLRKDNSRKHRIIQGLKSYQVCGKLMLLLNIVISIIVTMVVFEQSTIKYPGFMIYAIAGYTFYCLVLAIINVVKYKDRYNPIFSAIKRIEMVKALVSIFTLQVAMLTQFGNDKGVDSVILNRITGTIVCISILILAIMMLIGVKKNFKEMGCSDERE